MKKEKEEFNWNIILEKNLDTKLDIAILVFINKAKRKEFTKKAFDRFFEELHNRLDFETKQMLLDLFTKMNMGEFGRSRKM